MVAGESEDLDDGCLRLFLSRTSYILHRMYRNSIYANLYTQQNIPRYHSPASTARPFRQT